MLPTITRIFAGDGPPVQYMPPCLCHFCHTWARVVYLHLCPRLSMHVCVYVFVVVVSTALVLWGAGRGCISLRPQTSMHRLPVGLSSPPLGHGQCLRPSIGADGAFFIARPRRVQPPTVYGLILFGRLFVNLSLRYPMSKKWPLLAIAMAVSAQSYCYGCGYENGYGYGYDSPWICLL